MPSAFLPAIRELLANAASPEPPLVESNGERSALASEADAPEEPTRQVESGRALPVGDDSTNEGYLEPTKIEHGPQYTSNRTLSMPGQSARPREHLPEPSPIQASTPKDDWAVLEGEVTVLADARMLPEAAPVVRKVSAPPRPADHAAASSGKLRVQTARPPEPSKRGKLARSMPESHRTDPGIGAPPSSRPEPVPRSISDDIDLVKIPTRQVPFWIFVVVLGGVAAGATGLWLLTREGPGEGAPNASTSASASSASSAPSVTTSKAAKPSAVTRNVAASRRGASRRPSRPPPATAVMPKPSPLALPPSQPAPKAEVAPKAAPTPIVCTPLHRVAPTRDAADAASRSTGSSTHAEAAHRAGVCPRAAQAQGRDTPKSQTAGGTRYAQTKPHHRRYPD